MPVEAKFDKYVDPLMQRIAKQNRWDKLLDSSILTLVFISVALCQTKLS